MKPSEDWFWNSRRGAHHRVAGQRLDGLATAHDAGGDHGVLVGGDRVEPADREPADAAGQLRRAEDRRLRRQLGELVRRRAIGEPRGARPMRRE